MMDCDIQIWLLLIVVLYCGRSYNSDALHFDFKKESEAMRRDVKQSVLMELLDVVESLP